MWPLKHSAGCRLKKDASLEDLSCALCEARDGPMAGILDVTHDELVSSDFNGSHFSSVLDVSSSVSVNNKFLNLIAWLVSLSRIAIVSYKDN